MLKRILTVLIFVLILPGVGWGEWKPKSGITLGMGMSLGGGGKDEALYSGTGWTYNYATGIWSANPTLSNEVLLNYSFTNWTLGVPDNWTPALGGGDGAITQVGSGQGFGGAGTGSANLYGTTSSAYNPRLTQVSLTVGTWYYIQSIVSVINGSGIRMKGNSISYLPDITASGTFSGTFKADHASFVAQVISNPPHNDTIDSISIKPINTSTIFCKRLFTQQTAIKASLSVPTGSCAGVISRYSNISNYLVAYYNPLTATAYLDKIVGGTSTNLASGAVAYAQWKTIEIRFPTANTATLYYDGNTVGTTGVDISTIPAGNYAGLFATTSAVGIKSVIHTP